MQRFKPSAAFALVVANMIGTGVFTSLGFQLLDIQSGFALLLLWIIGGVIALCGAVTYAELAARFPRSGGEYNFIGRTLHPSLGFISGWISATVGYAAPTALAAMTFGIYFSSAIPLFNSTYLASTLVVILTASHCISVGSSGSLQSYLTLLKIVLIIVFCAIVWLSMERIQPIRFTPQFDDLKLITTSAFAVSLIYVNYAYTGWNAATYLIDELENPSKYLSKVLVLGTLFVTLIYLTLNATFLAAAPGNLMRGQEEIGFIVAKYVLGGDAANIIGVILALLLVSTVSAMVISGPRVLQVIGQDFKLFRWLSKTNSQGLPIIAIIFQGILSIGFIATTSFQSVLLFTGFTLGLNSLLTVAGIFSARRRSDSDPHYKLPFYPVPPLLFLILIGWTLIYLVFQRPVEGIAGLCIFIIGWFFWLGTRRFENN